MLIISCTARQSWSIFELSEGLSNFCTINTQKAQRNWFRCLHASPQHFYPFRSNWNPLVQAINLFKYFITSVSSAIVSVFRIIRIRYISKYIKECCYYGRIHRVLPCKLSKSCEEFFLLSNSYLNLMDKENKFFIFLSWLKEGASCTVQRSRLWAYRGISCSSNARCSRGRVFVRPLTQFPDAINILLTDVVNGWPD